MSLTNMMTLPMIFGQNAAAKPKLTPMSKDKVVAHKPINSE